MVEKRIDIQKMQVLCYAPMCGQVQRYVPSSKMLERQQPRHLGFMGDFVASSPGSWGQFRYIQDQNLINCTQVYMEQILFDKTGLFPLKNSCKIGSGTTVPKKEKI
jgi:hypothetical protein